MMPPAPLLDNDLKLINNSLSVDIPTSDNAETLNSLKSNSKGILFFFEMNESSNVIL